MVQEAKRPASLVDVARDVIEKAIYAGEWPAGHALREMDLARDLGVSRGTVRAAIRSLQEQGLVRVVPHRGASVAQMNATDLTQIYTFRALIEPYAARLAMDEQATECDRRALVESLHVSLAEMRSAEREANLEAMTRHDVDFHLKIVQAGRHDLLLTVYRSLLSRTRLAMMHSILSSGNKVIPEPKEHAEIVASVETNSQEVLARQLRDHALSALNRLLSSSLTVDSGTLLSRELFVRQLPWEPGIGGLACSAESNEEAARSESTVSVDSVNQL